MSNIVQALSKASRAVDKSLKHSSFEPGEVTSVYPFRIKLKDNNKLVLNADMFSTTSRIKDLINDDRLVIGSKVLVLVNKGGEELYVIDRIDNI